MKQCDYCNAHSLASLIFLIRTPLNISHRLFSLSEGREHDCSYFVARYRLSHFNILFSLSEEITLSGTHASNLFSFPSLIQVFIFQMSCSLIFATFMTLSPYRIPLVVPHYMRQLSTMYRIPPCCTNCCSYFFR